MNRSRWIRSVLLLLGIAGAGAGIYYWKEASTRAKNANAHHAEPMETVTSALVKPYEYHRTTTSIGTIVALRSITLRNEISGTVREAALVSGQVVEAGAVLVSLDVAVEQAELKAQKAQAALAQTTLDRMQRANQDRAASDIEVDRARAERDVALAQITRTEAIIDRKTIRAPFRARVGMADIHPGQYLNEGTQLTTLQGVDEAVHVDFAVAQRVAAGLKEGDTIEVMNTGDAPIPAKIVAVDARVDPATRNAWVRAIIQGAGQMPTPGASVRVRVPGGAPVAAFTVPVTALRRGPAGDHVFVLTPDKEGKLRAHLRPVDSGTLIGDEVLVLSGVTAGEQIAASGSFKLREGILVSVAQPQ